MIFSPDRDIYVASVDLRYAADGDNLPPGTFTGHGSVFNVKDSHGDIMLPGCFAESLTRLKASGRNPAMYLEHSAYKMFGDPLPVGKWDAVSEDGNGLAVRGRLVGTDHPDVKRADSLMREQLLTGLSIAFITPDDGAVMGKKSDDFRRQLKRVELLSIDIVGDPSNHLARITEMRSARAGQNSIAAAKALAEAIREAQKLPIEQREALVEQLQLAHVEITGARFECRSADTLREFEAHLRDTLGWSNSKARAVAERGLKSVLDSRDGNEPGTGNAADIATQELRDALRSGLSDLSLPDFA